MTAPTAPYTTSQLVASLLQVKLNKAIDFEDADSTPRKTEVDQFISWVSNAVNMRLGQAGYYVPLEVIEGETWPAHQTTYLEFVTTLGAAAYAGGHALRPAPALSPTRRGGTGNMFQDMFDAELDRIWQVLPRGNGKTWLRFRAKYYTGSPAEAINSEPKGATTDFMEGYIDPARYGTFKETADIVLSVVQEVESWNGSWDYIYNLFDIQKGKPSLTG